MCVWVVAQYSTVQSVRVCGCEGVWVCGCEGVCGGSR